MTEVNARPWFLAGFLHLGAAAALALVRAAPSLAFPQWLHAVVALAGLVLIAGGIAHGFVAPFLKREPRTALLAHASLALVLVADAIALADPLLAVVTERWWMATYAVAFALLPLHVALVALLGAPWRGGIALFAKDQPFRHGDTLAASGFAAALAALAAGAALLAFPPRGLPNAALAVLLLGFALPFFGAFLAFILPRNAKRPLPGLTLHAVAVGLLPLAGAGLALAFAFPLDVGFRAPAIAAALAMGLSITAFLRLRFPDPPGPQVRRARPLLRGALALGVLAPLVLVLGTLYDRPQLDLLAVALYLHVLLAGVMAVAATLLGAPILLNAVPREGRWAAWAAALAIASMFLLAPALQSGRSAFPAAAVAAVAAALVLWGVAPMRRPRRECD